MLQTWPSQSAGYGIFPSNPQHSNSPGPSATKRKEQKQSRLATKLHVEIEYYGKDQQPYSLGAANGSLYITKNTTEPSLSPNGAIS